MEIVLNVNHNFPEPKVTYSDYFCPPNSPKPTDTWFTILWQRMAANLLIVKDTCCQQKSLYLGKKKPSRIIAT